MSEEQYQNLQKGGQSSEEPMDALEQPHKQFSEAVAIDPGRTSGLSWTDGDDVRTWTSEFWSIVGPTFFSGLPPGVAHTDNTCVILEAPYLSRPGMHANIPAKAYNSGGVAREAKLIHERLEMAGYHVIEHDPAGQGPKWESREIRPIIGDWEGPDNDDTRDALRLLFFYNFI